MGADAGEELAAASGRSAQSLWRSITARGMRRGGGGGGVGVGAGAGDRKEEVDDWMALPRSLAASGEPGSDSTSGS